MKTKSIILSLLCIGLSCTFVFTGCKQKQQDTPSTVLEEFDINSIKDDIIDLVGSLPQQGNLENAFVRLQEFGLVYNDAFTLPVSEASRMMTTAQKSFALGMYAFDMTFASSMSRFDKLQEYNQAMNALANDLGLDLPILKLANDLIADQATLQNDINALNSIVLSNVFDTHEAFVKNNRVDSYAYMFLAANIEFFYIIGKSIQSNEKLQGVLGTILNNQKQRITILNSIMYKLKEDPAVAPVYEAFQPIVVLANNGVTGNADINKLVNAATQCRNAMLNK